ncbi:hypothetical protein T484DRAFT_1645972 [Baffinella frigidus]|nr:hypothetical protein T484DRAFT_1645972 [Cryptophyta sp. CCMP2293]
MNQVIELAAFINAPGAVRQALHADTLFSKDAALYTVFVALQDTSDEMGATILLPKSHTANAHDRFDDPDDQLTFLRTTPYTTADLKAGDALIYDSRTLHCGNIRLPNSALR